MYFIIDKENLQCGENKHGCQIDLNNHVKVLVHESVHHVTHKDQHCSGQSHLHDKLVGDLKKVLVMAPVKVMTRPDLDAAPKQKCITFGR